MKQFFTKQLTMLAMMFFACIGSAFGYTITLNFNGANATGANVEVWFECSNLYSWISNETPIEVSAGDNVAFRVEARSFYAIKKILLDGADITAVHDPHTGYTLSNISDNHTISIEWEKAPTNTIDLTLNSANAGAVVFNGEENTSFWFCSQKSSQIEVPTGGTLWMYVELLSTAQPIKTVKVDNVDVTAQFLTDEGYRFSDIAANHSVAIEFDQLASHTINVDLDNHINRCYFKEVETGNIVWLSEAELAAGKTVRLYLDPEPRYDYNKVFITDSHDGVTEAASTFKENGYYEFASLSDDYEVTVTTKDAVMHSITVNFDNSQGFVCLNNYRGDPDDGNTQNAEPSVSYQYTEGTNVRLTVGTTDWSCVLASIKVNNADITSDFISQGYYYDLNLNGDYTVDVTYKTIPHVTLNFDEGRGVVAINGTYYSSGAMENFPSGSSLQLTASPNEGYKIGSITVNGTSISMSDYKANGYYEFTLNEDCEVNVTFEEATYYNVQVSYNSGGGVAVSTMYNIVWDPGNLRIAEGSQLNLYVEPYGGYLPTVKIGGEEVALIYNPESRYYLCQITDDLQGDVSIDVTFTESEYTSICTSFNSSITEVLLNGIYMSPDVERNLTKGSYATLNIYPHIGYEIANVYLDNIQITPDVNGNYVFVVPDYDNCQLTVTVQKKVAPAIVPFTLPDSGVGTFCSEYDLDFSNMADIKAYVASGYNPTTQELVLTRVKEVPAGTGLLIKGNPGPYEIPTTDTKYMYANMLRGIVESEFIPQINWYRSWMGDMDYMSYLLGSDGQFYPANGESLEAYRAHLLIPASAVVSSSAKISTIFLDDEEESDGIATGIGFIWAGESAGKTKAANTDDVYNLQGQKVNSKTLKPGIYIRNGKKFMVK
jgi:hypothetical protein